MADGVALDEAVRDVDRLVAARDWDGLLAHRDGCRAAWERGHQLWPAASYAEYRLALDAPGPYAAAVLVAGTGHFALGPLPEVAASTHAWAELAPHVDGGPVAGLAAHERVARGEDLTGYHVAPVLDLPLVVQPWEPTYPVATYRPDGADFGDVPAPAALRPVERRPVPPSVDDPDSVGALLDVVSPWTTASNGTASAVAVGGDAASALAALGAPPTTRLAEVTAPDALSYLAWTAASGGAHGRRRGVATGRFLAWWTVAALSDLLDDWRAVPDAIGEAAVSLRWYRWDPGAPTPGWSLRLAVEDPVDGVAWAVGAVDSRDPRA